MRILPILSQYMFLIVDGIKLHINDKSAARNLLFRCRKINNNPPLKIYSSNFSKCIGKLVFLVNG